MYLPLRNARARIFDTFCLLRKIRTPTVRRKRKIARTMGDDVKPEVKPKQYGLITKSKTTFATRTLKSAANVFGDEESDEEQVGVDC